jgi:hypothetical protein
MDAHSCCDTVLRSVNQWSRHRVNAMRMGMSVESSWLTDCRRFPDPVEAGNCLGIELRRRGARQVMCVLMKAYNTGFISLLEVETGDGMINTVNQNKHVQDFQVCDCIWNSGWFSTAVFFKQAAECLA